MKKLFNELLEGSKFILIILFIWGFIWGCFYSASLGWHQAEDLVGLRSDMKFIDILEGR